MADLPPGQIEVWTVIYASYGDRDISGGSTVHFSEHDAVESLRAEVLGRVIDNLEMQDYGDAEFQRMVVEETDRFAKLTTRELEEAYANQSDDWYWYANVCHHIVTAPTPVPVDIPGIEKFLEGSQ